MNKRTAAEVLELISIILGIGSMVFALITPFAFLLGIVGLALYLIDLLVLENKPPTKCLVLNLIGITVYLAILIIVHIVLASIIGILKLIFIGL